MEIVNNRYRIIKNLKQNNSVSKYLVTDLWDEYQEIELSLLNTEFIPSALIDYYSKEFVSIINIGSTNIQKNFGFNTLSYIDNKPTKEEQFFYTSEYFHHYQSLLEFSVKLNTKQIIELFIDLCKAVNFLHLKGFIYGSLNLGNIMMVEDHNSHQSKIMLRDIASVELDRYDHKGHTGTDSYFTSPKVVSGEVLSISADMYSLGILLLTMLTKQLPSGNPNNELVRLQKEKTHLGEDEKILLEKLLPFIEKLTATTKVYPYANLQDFIQEFNRTLGTSYSIVSRKEIEKLHFHTKLVGRVEGASSILESHRQMHNFKPFRKIFVIKGNTGAGKTRFLEEIKFLLELERANVYSSFSLKTGNNNSNKMWVDLLRKLVLESEREIIEKYESELLEYFPELIGGKCTLSPKSIKEHTKFRLLNRITGFINDSIKNKPSVILIDDIHLADDFTIDTLTYLCTEVIKNNNIILVFSVNEGTEHHPLVSEFLNQLKPRNDSSTIYMNPLDVEQTGQFIKHILAMPHNPIKLAETIYSQTYGNPLFICETIKDLYSRKIIFVNDETGRWSIDLPDNNAYEMLSIPSNIEQALLNQIKDLSHINYEILFIMSIFTKPLSIRTIAHFIDLSAEHLESVIEELVNKGIVSRFISDSSYLYDFNNQVLKNIVYGKMTEIEKRAKHQMAAKLLENEVETNSALHLEELILHFERAGMIEMAKNYSIKNAQRMRDLKNSRGEIKNLEKALSLVNENEARVKIGLVIELGISYSDTGDTQLSLDLFSKAEKLALENRCGKSLIEIYINTAHVYSLLYNNEMTEKYLEKTEKLLTEFVSREAELEVKRIRALMLVDNSSLDAAAKLFHELLEECGDGYHKTKGNTYRHLGYIYVFHNRIEEALELYNQSIKVLEKINYTRGILLALNNIGSIYNDSFNDPNTALDYYIKVRDLSEEYGISSSEVFGLLNIAAIHWRNYNLTTADEHFKEALKKAIRNNFVEQIFYLYTGLTIVNREMSQFSTAFDYYHLAQKELELNPNRGMDILDYYITCSNLYYSFGRFQEALEFENKIIEFHKDRDHPTRTEAMIRRSVYLMRFQVTVNDGEISEIIDEISMSNSPYDFKINLLCEASQILSNKKNYIGATRFLDALQMEITESTPDQLMAKVYYTKGSAETGIECTHYLLKALEYARKVKNKDLIAKILLKLGDYYYSNGDYYSAANHYIDSSEILKQLIPQIPDEFRLTYVNGYCLARGFNRLEYIKNAVIKKKRPNTDIDGTDLSLYVSGIEELTKVLRINHANAFKESKEFMHFISTQYMTQLSKDILTTKDILTHLSNNTLKDIEMVLKYLAAITLATRGIVAITGNQQSLKVIASIDENYALPGNQFIFDRVKSNADPILLSNQLTKVQGNQELTSEDIRSCLCVPITSHHLQMPQDAAGRSFSGRRNNILGYLYLESDRHLNNLNKDGLNRCLDLRNFLALLIEKHQLKLSASVDKLTGALTRKYLEDALIDTLENAASCGESFSLIMYDLDRFKKVNDKFGHQTGDEVLKKVSKIVIDHLGRRDTLGRYGGEEFTIILPGQDSEQAYHTAEEIRGRIEREKILGNKTDITISMGVVTYPDHAQSINELISKADQALYVAKENGRNECKRWDNAFVDMVKPTNKLTGIISGNEVQDSRNVLALVELIQLINKSAGKEDKIHDFLGRIIEVSEAQYGFLLVIDHGEMGMSYGRKTQIEGWAKPINFNHNTINSVIQDKQSLFLIDWDDTDKHNPLTGLPDWHSILAVPVLVENEVKGIIYLSVPTRLKEFGINELNIVNVFGDLAASLIK